MTGLEPSLSPDDDKEPFRILALDGGGTKGAYTLGVLAFIENQLGGEPLANRFQLIYGTSTGSIIGSMLALGDHVQTIWQRYQCLVPEVMGRRFAKRRSARLKKHADNIYGKKLFDCFLTRVGIVTVNLDLNGPMISAPTFAIRTSSDSKRYTPEAYKTLRPPKVTRALCPHSCSRTQSGQRLGDPFTHVFQDVATTDCL